jgi:ABC-type bacteriocin/lantibiotic exporter with double-glycine peptidase domain
LNGLKELGISGRKVLASAGIDTVNPPAMLFIRDDTHAVVYVGRRGELLEIWNPSFGKSFMPESRLRQLWDGHALEFNRSRN